MDMAAAARRLNIIQNHLRFSTKSTHIRNGGKPESQRWILFNSTANRDDGLWSKLLSELTEIGVTDVEVEPPPKNMEKEYITLFTPEAVKFVAQLVKHFNNDVDLMLKERIRRKAHLDITGEVPAFTHDPEVHDKDWMVAPVPNRVIDRRLDLGDVSPANTEKFVEALCCPVNGIQTDFDDGHCPTWQGQLRGLYNVYRAVHGLIPNVPEISKVPVLMLRPRAWNMIEHNMLPGKDCGSSSTPKRARKAINLEIKLQVLARDERGESTAAIKLSMQHSECTLRTIRENAVDGKEVPGPLLDFGLLMFHCASRLVATESGPFFYLSKLEGANEARLWNKIFCWTQDKLSIPQGTIKACVLIENILASFEMEKILYELREHSLGLNCGIWDYSASFVNKFGHRKDFILPDRNKYVNMQRHFLRSYMDLVIHVCHKHGAHATGGMAATILESRDLNIVTKVSEAKMREMLAGVDGFMVYDTRLIPVVQRFMMYGAANQIDRKRDDVNVRAWDLLQVPSGGVTLAGLKHNIEVGILFIDSWLRGQGHYIYKGAVEDSATAEISRSQVWQWIRHQATLEDNGKVITRKLVQSLIEDFLGSTESLSEVIPLSSVQDKERLKTAAEIFEEVVTKRDFPEFLTTYLNLDHTFLKYQKLYA
ncbi:Malate synthase [Halocaridina rubra]|uniref:malate synthase n=1 Tax=Halocaridina rubra TaxID=373956 RepID=A0AAN9A5M3_HALRR